MSKPTCLFHSPEDPTSLLRKNPFKPKQNYWQKLDFPTDELEFGSGTYIRKFGIDNVLRQKKRHVRSGWQSFTADPSK